MGEAKANEVAMTLEPELRCQNVSLTFPQARNSARKNSLYDVSFALKPGDSLGLIGPNGAGKSTLLRVLAGIYVPDKGSIVSAGKVTLLADLMASLEPEFSGYKNIELAMAYWGIPYSDLDDVIEDVLTFTELEPAMNERLINFSAGMKMRLAFALATYAKPDIFLIDEVIGTGDNWFRTKSYERLLEVLNKTIVVMATHSEEVLRKNCTVGLVLNRGEVQFFGSIESALNVNFR